MKLTLILTIAFVGVKGTSRPTRDIEFKSNKASTVVIGSDLLTVSYYDVKLMVNSTEQRQVYLDLTSSDYYYKPCMISLNPEMDTILGRVEAASIWRKIVVWGARSSIYYKTWVSTNYTFLLIDPRTCTYQALPKITDMVLQGVPGEPKVVIHQDRLDIFFASQTVCSPCTFDLNGDKIDSKKQLKAEKASEFHIRTIGKNHGYVVIYKMNVGSVALKLFDQYFKFKGSIHLDSGTVIRVVAINSVGNHPYLGIISVSEKHPSRQPIYTVFDHNLNTVFKTYLPLLHDYNNDDAFANIDSVGNSSVTLIQREKRGPNWKITMARYDANGPLVDEVILGTKVHLGVAVGYKEQTMLIGEREYCLVIHTSRGFKPVTESTQIRCIDVSGRA